MSEVSASGLWPINSDIFDDSEYAGSLVTDREEPVKESVTCEQNVLTTPPVLAVAAGFDATKSINMPSTSNHLTSVQDVSPKHKIVDDNPTPSTSNHLTSLGLQTTLKYVADELMDSLEKIRPFPKAEMKMKKRGGRKPGRSRVLTDTPEKML